MGYCTCRIPVAPADLKKSVWYSHLEECSILSSGQQGDRYDNDFTQSYVAE